MLGGLRRNLIAAIVTTTAALVLSIVLLEDPLVQYRATEWARDDLQDIVQRAGERIGQGGAPDHVADVLGAQAGTRLRVWSNDGRLLGDTARDGEGLKRSASPPALLQRVADRKTASRVHRDGEDGSRMEVALALGDGRVVHASRALDAVDMARDSMRELLLVGGVMAVLISAALTWMLSRTVVRPARQLTEVANSLAEGDLSARAHIQRSDEFGVLGGALDRMADQLDERLRTLRAEEARLRTVLDAMVEAVFVTDPRGRIVLTNTALDRMLGADARGRTAVEAIRSPELHDAVRGARKGRAAYVDLDTRVGEELRSFSAQVAPLPDDAGVVGVLHDVTNLKMADRIRRDFVANASHELRTPLTAVRGFAETLRDGAAADSESAKRFAEMMLKHTLRLQRLVDDLLALSRAESPDERFDLEVVDVGRVAAEAARGLESQARDKGLEMEVEEMGALPGARGSTRALDQVLVNLIDNAIKYTPAEGRVTVRGYEDGDRIVVEVSDTGSGIPSPHLERIFERFYRVDKGRSREVGGTGLGLSIVKHLAARMGGDIQVDSHVGSGTTFRVRLRRAGEAAAQDAPHARPA